MCVPHGLGTAKMCERADGADPWMLYYTPDCYKRNIGVPECFVRSQQIKIWLDSDDHDDEDVSWYEGYQKRKVPGITACP